jgi:polyisoprenoid-binding protein YceI
MLNGPNDMKTHIDHACRTFFLSIGFIFLLSISAVQLSARQVVFRFDPAQTKVEYTLGDILHTVHGTFRMKNGLVEFDTLTGAAQGLIVVDATSGNSGSEARDQKMHQDILESQRYQDITFTPIHVQGQFADQQPSQLSIEGMLNLHGSQHPVTVVAHINPGQDRLDASTHFDVPYVKWGLKNPSNFILRVSSTVKIDIHAIGRLLDASGHP